MLGYAILAIKLEDLVARASASIIEPYAGEVTDDLRAVTAYAGRLASLLHRRDLAEQHLSNALKIVGVASAQCRRLGAGRCDHGRRRRPIGFPPLITLDRERAPAVRHACRGDTSCPYHEPSWLAASWRVSLPLRRRDPRRSS